MTEQYNNFERELDWNDQITQDSEFVILEPGEYWFKVEKFERGRHTPNPQNPGKLPACNKAALTLEIVTNDGQTKKLTHNLFLHSRTEGMLSAFFGAIGQKKHKEPLQMNWNLVPGAVGVCSIKKGLSRNGNEFNEVGYMIYQDDVDPTKQLNQRPGMAAQPMMQAQPQFQQQPPVQQYQQQPLPTPQPQQWQQGSF